MRALTYPTPEPQELTDARGAFRPGVDPTDQAWSDFGTSGGKTVVRAALWQMSGERCAYCEAKLDEQGHIEHFRRKRHNPALTFVWDNLLPSCGSLEHCGHFKDRNGAPPYQVAHLIHPGQQDPEQLLTYSSDGKIQPRIKPGDPRYHHATETIRILGLDNEKLRRRRENGIKAYKPLLNDPSFTVGDLVALVDGVAHETAILHGLGAR